MASYLLLNVQLKEFIDVCKAGEVDQLIDICLSLLGIEGEAATEVSHLLFGSLYLHCIL